MRFFAIAGIAVTALMTALSSAPVAAQQWPARSVKLIVPYPAGGNVDGAARIIADKLQTMLGQPFIVENKAGAGGLIAGEAFAKSTPDGYTLFVGANGPVLFAPEIAKRDAYNWKRDFLPISSISMTPLVLEVHPSVAAKDLKEFFDLARREPGKMTMASPGAGTTNHLLSELVQSTLGIQWVTAHYRGNAPAINDLIGGQVQFAFDQISVGLPFIKNGNVRALAVTGSHRASWIPDVPTFAELGYKEFDGQTFTGLFAPSGTPAEIVTKLHDTMATILKDPAIVEKFNTLGAEAVTMTPAAFKSYLEAEDAKWIPVVRKANIKSD
ncbi:MULTISPECIES: tripartite tricarboxylate transporter substrate binding protein [unclassified Bradyrhizobium]|uniref:Bug family tripartite tricarboxylate transporter substrate binding protein n=1 Tax=unclassified Bradyrhizobium TaxID=2631580 RepID=UPI001BA62E98|nr:MULTISPECIES: tripartite tricarboxylate transporter substrate binding protein [unclassified Bradyrhizobium]MBR1225020.1 tripartite tricarboxylate transporter substrate binding protein [Bradyrhizobium sp. AUGA SZCCT0176]MBR1233085.1 tripartite tricarboxylate transporter substrate binding protein [Bradyrhizobium sp. AUGA SZCCT0182]MBR1300417.1 tripartite tricarboxylate transporter substrate binding protein [Bradyrhizobium sp. AUGA SZCCT0042]